MPADAEARKKSAAVSEYLQNTLSGKTPISSDQILNIMSSTSDFETVTISNAMKPSTAATLGGGDFNSNIHQVDAPLAKMEPNESPESKVPLSRLLSKYKYPIIFLSTVMLGIVIGVPIIVSSAAGTSTTEAQKTVVYADPYYPYSLFRDLVVWPPIKQDEPFLWYVRFNLRIVTGMAHSVIFNSRK